MKPSSITLAADWQEVAAARSALAREHFNDFLSQGLESDREACIKHQQVARQFYGAVRWIMQIDHVEWQDRGRSAMSEYAIMYGEGIKSSEFVVEQPQSELDEQE